MSDPHLHSLHDAELTSGGIMPEGAVGIDAGLTLTKVARASDGRIRLSASETGEGVAADGRGVVGVTGARGANVAAGDAAHHAQEIEAAARGVMALLTAEGRAPAEPFVLALLGTGTAFAAVRDGSVAHLGGTALGGGSFNGIARRINSALTYDAMIAGASRGDRRNVDTMVSDAYPGGIGRIGPDLTAAHLAADGGSPEDVLAALLNMHGENIAQIAASRARIAGLSRVVLAGGFAHNNAALVASITSMAAMFGIAVDVSPAPGYAGAIGAAILAAVSVEEEAAR